ncbi:MAG: L-lactate dehydrogenase [Bacillota bacterium]|nr:L-lactate dehydrogenase [Bacillota bacterium]
MSKITILGVGNVGATIAYALTINGVASHIVLLDINKNKAEGEALDIHQGIIYCPTVDIYSGDYADAADSDIVIVTLGIGRKPGQTRIDLAQTNVNIIKEAIPQVLKYAPNAIYVVVSNPVDVITYTMIKRLGIPKNRVLSTGTMLDTARLRSILSKQLNISAKDIHAYVLGEHGDTSVIPWSLATIAGMPATQFKQFDTQQIDIDTRTAGAKIISLKGATYYAIALAVLKVCTSILRDTGTTLTVSTLIEGQYGIEDVAMSLPFLVNSKGIDRALIPPLNDKELIALHNSAHFIKETLNSLDI